MMNILDDEHLGMRFSALPGADDLINYSRELISPWIVWWYGVVVKSARSIVKFFTLG